jgi:endonuclease/exonuclease/phosphatase family metal-dependent hydrolase
MKIATWNLERPNKFTKRNREIVDCLEEVNADILILTESNEIINFGENYNNYHSSKLEETYYKEGERRVSIYSKFNAIEHLETFRSETSICVKFKTPLGDLTVYGTVIGIHGNRRASFMEDLNLQLADFERIGRIENLCIAGDFNISFSDNYYFTQEGRIKLINSFTKLDLLNVTANIPNNIDHIVLPINYVNARPLKIQTWNVDKMLSDHIGVAVEILDSGVEMPSL